MNHQEYILQKQVCQYLNLQYPKVMFLSTGVSLEITKMQGNRHKAINKNGFKCPDLLILQPNKFFHGLFIELKIASPYLKNGQLKKNDHIEGQNNSIEELKKLGYYACFAWEFESIKKLIDNYMEDATTR